MMSGVRTSTLLRASGAVAVVMGLHGVLTGTRGVARGPRDVPFPGRANVDSEFRFFAAWYAVTGALSLRAAEAPDGDDVTTRAIGAGWLLAALGRLRAMRASGRPHPLFLLLLAAELVLGVALSTRRR
jgi:hypothetical protein